MTAPVATTPEADVEHAASVQNGQGVHSPAGDQTLVPGDLDPTFGVNGFITSDFGGQEPGYGPAVLPDDRLIVAGYTSNGEDLVLARYTANGQLDVTFGTGGRTTTDFGPGLNGGANDVVLQPDGKILVAGSVGPSGAQAGSWMVARYDSSGNLDTSFGIGGFFIKRFGSTYETARKLLVQPDGKIVVMGYAGTDHGVYDIIVMRLNANGTLDDGSAGDSTPGDSFGTGGFNRLNLGETDLVGGLARQPDGKLLVSGSTGPLFGADSSIVIRYNVDGSLDSSFGNAGIAVANVSNRNSASSIAIAADGSILVGGIRFINEFREYSLLRYTASGQLDTTFGESGRATAGMATPTNGVHGLVVQSDGKILGIGTTLNGTGAENVGLVRWNPDGSLDMGFGRDGNGTVVADLTGNQDEFYNLVIQSNGRIVVAGFSMVAGSADFSLAGFYGGNLAPTAVTLSNVTSILPEDTSTATRLRVADIQITDDGAGTNVLSLAGDDAAFFEIVGTSLFLKAATALDFEAKPSYSVTVRVNDATLGSSPDATVDYTLSIGNVNEPPAITLTNLASTLPENADTSSRTRVADIVVTDDALGTNTLSLDGADAASFEIVGSSLFLKAGAALDFETKPTFSVTVQIDDTSVGVTPDASASFTLALLDANDPPAAIQLSNTVTSFTENTSTAVPIRVADLLVIDDILGSNNLSLSGPHAGLFEIAGTQLFLRAGARLDFETSPVLHVTINADDPDVGGVPDVIVGFDITLVDVPEAATVIAGFDTAIRYTENTAPVLLDTTVTVTDTDSPNYAFGTLTVTVTQNAEAGDRLSVRNQGVGGGQIGVNGLNVTFAGTVIGVMSGGLGNPLSIALNANCTLVALKALIQNLQYADLADAPLTAPKRIELAVRGGDGMRSGPVAKTVTVTAANDPPALGGLPASVAFVEAGGKIALAPGATVTDPDSANLAMGRLTVRISANGNANDRLSLRNDGTGAGQIGVSGTNVTFGGTVIGTVFGGTGMTALFIMFNAQATPAAAQALLRNLTFENVSANPTTAPRTIQVSLTDGDGGTTNAPNITVNVVAVNTAPTIGGFNSTVNYGKNAAPILLDTAATITDPDSTHFFGGALTVSIAANADVANDVIAIQNQGTFFGRIGVVGTNVTFGGALIGSFTGGTAGNPLVITFSSTAATPAAAQALLRAITFASPTATPSTLLRTVRAVLNDGAGGISAPVSKTITVGKPPVIGGFMFAATFREKGAAVLVGAGATVTDADSPNLNGGRLTLTLTANADPADVLAIQNQGTGAGKIGVVGSNVTFGGTLIGTVSGGAGGAPLVVAFTSVAATPTAIQTLLRAVTFANGSNNPSVLPRTLQAALQDGDGLPSVAVAKTIHVIAVNDPPMIGGFEEPVMYFIGNGPILPGESATVTDFDSSDFNIGVLTVRLSANGHANDRLSVRNQGTAAGQIGVSGTSVTFGGGVIGTMSGGMGIIPLTIRLNASATPAAAQALLRNVTFNNVSANPTLLPRTVQVTLTDGDNGTSALRSRTIAFSRNSTPTTANSAVTIDEDGQRAFGAADFPFVDADPADQFRSVKIVSLPSQGTLTWNGQPVTVGQVILAGTLDQLVFTPHANGNGSPYATFQFQVSDGTVFSTSMTMTVNVTSINDSPVLEGIESGAIHYTTDDPPATLTSTLVASDVDSPTLMRVVVTITGNYAAGQDLLAAETLPDSITAGAFDPETGSITLTGNGSATAAEFTAALRGITFSNISASPQISTRTVQFVVYDGGRDSNVAVRSITVAFTADQFAAQLALIDAAQPMPEQVFPLDLTAYQATPLGRAAELAVFDIASGYAGQPGIDALNLPTLPGNATAALVELQQRLTGRLGVLESEIAALGEVLAAQLQTPEGVATYATLRGKLVERATLGLLQQDLLALTAARLEEEARIAGVRVTALESTIVPETISAGDAASDEQQLEALVRAVEAQLESLSILLVAQQTADDLGSEARFDAGAAAAAGVAAEIQTLVDQARTSLATLESQRATLEDLIAHPLDHTSWQTAAGVDFSQGIIPGQFGRYAIAPDDSTLLMIESGNVTVRDARTGSVVHTWSIPGVKAVAATGDGRFWSLTSDTLALRELGTGNVLWQMVDLDHTLLNMTATRDGSLVAVEISRTVLLFRRNGDSATRTDDFPFTDSLQADLHFNTSGSQLAVPMQGTLVLLDTNTGVRREFTGFHDWVSATAWSPDGTMVAAGDFTGFVRIIDVPTSQVIGSFQMPFNYYVGTLVFSPNQALLATGDPNVGLMFWDITQLNQIREYARSTAERDLAYFQTSLTGNTLLARTQSGLIAYAMPEAGRGAPISRANPPILNPVPPTAPPSPDHPAWQQSGKVDGTLGIATQGRYSSLTADGQKFVVADGGTTVRILSVATGQTLQTLDLGVTVDFAAITADGQSLVYIARNALGTVSFVGKRNIAEGTGEVLETLSSLLMGVTVDSAHDLMAISDHSGGGRVRLIDLATGASTEIAETEGHSEGIAISESGRYVAAGRGDGKVVVFDRTTGQSRTLTGLTRTVRALAWSHGGDSLLAAADDNARVALYAPAASTQPLSVYSIPFDSDPTTGLAFSTNNLLLFRGANANGLLALDVSAPGSIRVSNEIPILELNDARGLTLSPSGETLLLSATANNLTFITGLAVPVYGRGPAGSGTPLPPPATPPTVPPLNSAQQNELAAPTTVATLNATQRQHLLNSVNAYFNQRVREGGSGGVASFYLGNMESNPGLLGLSSSASYRSFYDAVVAHMESTWPLDNAPQLDALAGGSGVYIPPETPVTPPAPTPTQTKQQRTAAELVLAQLGSPVHLGVGRWVSAVDPNSTTHVGAEQYAVDLNMVVDDNDSNPFADRGQPVFAPMAGMIVELVPGRLVLRSTVILSDGSTVQVYQLFEHLKIDVALERDDVVQRGAGIGKIDLLTDGGVQGNGNVHIRPHLHWSVHLGSVSAPSLNLATWLARNHISVLLDPNGTDTGGPSASNSELILDWYNSSDYLPSFYVNQDTLAGKMFLGYLRRFDAADQNGTVSSLVQVVSEITGILENTILLASPSGSASARASSLMRLFRQAQYGSIFFSSGRQLNAATNKFVGSTGTALDTYHDFSAPGWAEDSHVRIRFDAVLTHGGLFDHAHVYLIDEQTNAQIGVELTAEIKDRLYVDVPLAKLAAVIGPNFQYGGPFGPGGAQVAGGLYRIKLVVWNSNDPNTYEGSHPRQTKTSPPFRLEHLINDFAVRRNLDGSLKSTQQIIAEEAILQLLSDADHFVVRNPGDWRVEIGSPYHDGGAYHAVDVNRGSSGPADHGEKVFAPASGKVVYWEGTGGDTYNTLIIEHALEDGTEFYTKYLHMEDVQVTRVINGSPAAIPMELNMEIFKDDQLGVVGDTGSEGAFHLHFEVLTGSRFGASINLSLLLQNNYGMKAWVTDAGPDNNQETNNGRRIEVRWNNMLNSFTTFDPASRDEVGGQFLVVDRREQVDHHPMEHADEARIHWLAYESGKDLEEMRSVVWKSLEHMNDSGALVTADLWVDVENDDRRWSPLRQMFVDRLTGAVL